MEKEDKNDTWHCEECRAAASSGCWKMQIWIRTRQKKCKFDVSLQLLYKDNAYHPNLNFLPQSSVFVMYQD